MSRSRAHAAPRDRRRRAWRVGREVALWAGALVGVACLVLTVLGAAFDVRPVVFRSGSMEPSIGTGALAITRTVPAAELEVGDVVTVRTAEGVRVTHRIRSISPNGEQATLVLKGDANQVVDADPYVVSAADRVLFSVPEAGYVVNAFGSRPATFAGGILVGLLLVLAFGRRRRDEPLVAPATAPVRTVELPVTEIDNPVRRRPALAVAIGVAAAVVLVAGVKGTTAYFNDSAQVGTGTFSAKAAPSLITACTRNTSSGDITVTWSAYAGATSYRITTGSGTINSVTSPRTVAVGKNSEGAVTITAVTPSGNVTSIPWTYDGNGANQACHP